MGKSSWTSIVPSVISRTLQPIYLKSEKFAEHPYNEASSFPAGDGHFVGLLDVETFDNIGAVQEYCQRQNRLKINIKNKIDIRGGVVI